MPVNQLGAVKRIDHNKEQHLNIYYFIPYQIQPFRNKNQVYLLLHAIRQVLPDDVRILADPELELTGVKTSLCALNQEITNLQQNLQSLSQNSDKSHARFYTSYGHGPECRVKDGDDVRALREEFERKREREIVEKETLSWLAGLEKLWHDFVEDQMSVDVAVAET